MTQVKNWLSQFQRWTHWFAGVVISAGLAYGSNEALRKAVNSALAGAPRLAVFVASAAAVVVAYANSRKSGN